MRLLGSLLAGLAKIAGGSRGVDAASLLLGASALVALGFATGFLWGSQRKAASESGQGDADKPLRALMARYTDPGNPKVAAGHTTVWPMSLRYIDTFLKWRSSAEMLRLGLFPDAEEISKSVARAAA